jgi:hypothetical protein
VWQTAAVECFVFTCQRIPTKLKRYSALHLVHEADSMLVQPAVRVSSKVQPVGPPPTPRVTVPVDVDMNDLPNYAVVQKKNVGTSAHGPPPTDIVPLPPGAAQSHYDEPVRMRKKMAIQTQGPVYDALMKRRSRMSLSLNVENDF